MPTKNAFFSTMIAFALETIISNKLLVIFRQPLQLFFLLNNVADDADV